MDRLARIVRMGPSVPSEEELRWIERAKAGDAQALDWLVRSQWERVHRLLGRVWGTRPDLEDLVQNTFLETLRALPSFRRDSELSTFVAGIAIRVARRATRPRLVVQHAMQLDEQLPSFEAAPEQQARIREALRRARRILDKISEPKRVAFLLWALEGLDPQAIGDAMGASLAATRSRIYYAQRELLEAAQRDPLLQEWLSEVRDD
ncbi:MAG: RNA polymerase sigma factor [Polyangiales bacterium]